ncbi:diacylglycerol/lipid kinase family protein [Vallicoccus soli]|uniref:DAGKc domain-containing protein n=1 Tax=Vallicoccus soli TaxID=2339232 RepID=A0A3A3YP35_9ACTN|nr:diacylglycerol kinase family protein [Vallicoccus soli]RJK93171.1 hypothetical protein D5H78_17345 [Vallicoccus soli]
MTGGAAGSGRAARLLTPVLARLRAAGVAVVPVGGPGPLSAERQLREALRHGVDAVVALGGDGTVHLALQQVAATPVRLGVVPAGSGDDVARSLGLPRDADAALDAVLAGHWSPVDAGLLDAPGGERWFLSVLCAGYDAVVAERARALRRPRGPARYPAAAVAALPALRARPYRLVLDGREVQEEAVLLAVGSGSTYGGGLRICPGADPHDGLLDVVLVRPLAVPRLAALLPRIYAGSHLGHPAVVAHRARVVRVEPAGAGRGPACAARGTRAAPPGAWADGEPVAPLPVTVRAVPGAVRVLGAPGPRHVASRA